MSEADPDALDAFPSFLARHFPDTSIDGACVAEQLFWVPLALRVGSEHKPNAQRLQRISRCVGDVGLCICLPCPRWARDSSERPPGREAQAGSSRSGT